MIIRNAVAADASGIARVHVVSWRETYRGIISDQVLDGLSIESRQSFWEERIAAGEPGKYLYVAESDSGEIVGFAAGGPERDGREGYQSELYAIYVIQSYHNRGIGRSLVRRFADDLLEADSEAMYVWVLAENPAVGFYSALGGRKIAERWIDIGQQKLLECCFGWLDLSK